MPGGRIKKKPCIYEAHNCPQRWRTWKSVIFAIRCTVFNLKQFSGNLILYRLHTICMARLVWNELLPIKRIQKSETQFIIAESILYLVLTPPNECSFFNLTCTESSRIFFFTFSRTKTNLSNNLAKKYNHLWYFFTNEYLDEYSVIDSKKVWVNVTLQLSSVIRKFTIKINHA